MIEALLQDHRHTFIYGSAGTGKSTLLRELRTHAPKGTVALAPTGIAAIHIHGETIHSFFQFKPSITPQLARELGLKNNRSKDQTYQALKTIIIDEISMVRADLMDAMDNFLREARQKDVPFGGVRLIVFGNLFQLPPVVNYAEQELFSHHYPSPYFYDAFVFRDIPFRPEHWHLHELTVVYRQQDESLIRFLEQVRQEDLTMEDLQDINQHLTAKQPQEQSIYLTTTNRRAQEINTQALLKLPGPPLTLEATITKEVRPDQYPCAPSIDIKIGARVMLVNNDPMGRWKNGSLGYITHIDIDHIAVALDGASTVKVKECTWDIHTIRYNPKKEQLESLTTGTYQQYPLTLAWAITIHKAQGKSFDHVHIDLERGAFVHGQTYVALSRARTLQGLSLEKPLRPHDLRMPQEPKNFFS